MSYRRKPGIYIIRNTITNKCYIGSSICPKSRIKEHFNSLDKNKHHSRYLQNSYNKHGKKVFEYGIIEHVNKEELLIVREQFWIGFFDSYNNGYNVCPCAGNTLGRKHTEEYKKKARERMLGENNPMYGQTHSEEARRKIADGDKSGFKTPQFREKMSIITSGQNNGMFGKNHSEGSKAIISTKVKERGGHNGTNNPNYGNKWNEKQKEHLRESIAVRGGMSGTNNPNYGNTKINKDLWPKIYLLVKQDGVRVVDLAQQHNVTIGTIYNILKAQEIKT